MRTKDYEVAKSLKDRLSTVVRLVDFRVFGSRARGDNEELSDMDVFLEVECESESIDKELRNKIGEIIWEVGFENYIVLSPLIFTRNEIENTPLRSSPIVKNIIKEGVVV